MPRKKVVKEPLEKVKDDQVVLEIIEDSSDEDGGAPYKHRKHTPNTEQTAIKVTKGNEVITDMSVDDIKKDIAKPARRTRVLTDEQKAKMKAGREKKKAEKALQVGKEQKRPAPIITTNLSPPPVEEPPVPKEEEMPRWFKSYLATQKKSEPVKEAPAKKPRGRPKGKKDTKPRTKKQSNSDLEEVQLSEPKKTMRFI